jgi:hypothetical protein
MDFVIDQLAMWWQFTVVGCLILIGLVVNLFDNDKLKSDLIFTYKEMPHLKPLPIATKGKGFWGAIKLWLLGVRHWELTKDFTFAINGVKYVIPKGFQFDGASVPKFLATWLSPTGVLLMGGLVHDYAYKYGTLLHTNKKTTMGPLNQKSADRLFRDICIAVNGFVLMNWLAYVGLRLGGFVAWNGHRKANCQAV